MLKIDSHAHVLTYPKDIPHFVKEAGILNIEETTTGWVMVQGNMRRPITEVFSFPDERRKWMKEHGIAHSIIYPLSQLYLNTVKNKETVMGVLDWQRDHLTALQHDHPGEFTTGILIQPRYVDDALKRIEDGVKDNLRIVFLCSHYFDYQDTTWKAFGEDPNVAEPILELMNKHHLAGQVHPYDMEHIVNVSNKFWKHHTLYMPTLTADTFSMVTGNGYHTKYPNVRMAFAHGDKAWLTNAGRIQQGYNGRKDLYPNFTPPEEVIGSKNLYFDTLFHDYRLLQLAISIRGADQFFAGLDSPYPLGDFKLPGYKPFMHLERMYPHRWNKLLHTNERKKLYSKNAIKRVGGDLQQRLQKRST